MLPFPESLQKKPTSFVGLGDGRFGGLRGIEQLMMLFAYRNAHLFSERTFITDVSNNFDEATGPKSEFIKKILHEQVKNFAQFTKKFMA
jgi:NAD(P)H-dependent FMN reductase